MKTRTQTRLPVTILAAVALLAPAAPALAQQAASAKVDSQAVYADYYATAKTLNQQHTQKLTEIDQQYRDALKEYSEENVRRAQALAGLNTADHKALREKGLSGAERQSEIDRIQAADKKRRAEYAEWRDTTATRLREEHAAARSAEIDRHEAEMNRLLSDRNAKLAPSRALDGSAGLSAGASAALGDAIPPGSDPVPIGDEAGEDDAAPEAEMADDDSGVVLDDAEEAGLQSLQRANDSMATVGTADDATGSDSDGDGSDGSPYGDDLEVLERADEGMTVVEDGTSGSGDSDDDGSDRSAPGVAGAGVAVGGAAVTGGSDTARVRNRGDFSDIRSRGNIEVPVEEGDYAPIGGGAAGTGAGGAGGTPAAPGAATDRPGAARDAAGGMPALPGTSGSFPGSTGVQPGSGGTPAGATGTPPTPPRADATPAGTVSQDAGGPGTPAPDTGSTPGRDVDAPVRSDDGKSFGWSDGTNFTTRGPDGSTGVVNENGDIVFGDGTTVQHTGEQEVVIHNPDGSSSTHRTDDQGRWSEVDSQAAAGNSSGSGVDMPQQSEDGSSFGWSDGTNFTARGPDGSPGVVNEKGDIVYGDGTTVVHTGEQEIVIHNPDGSHETYRTDSQGQWQSMESGSASNRENSYQVDPPVRSDDGSSYGWSDGTNFTARGPDGSTGVVNEKGDIEFADGTLVVHTGEQEVVIHNPDGSYETQRADENGQWHPVGGSDGSGSGYSGHGSGSGGSSESGSASGGGGSGSSSGSGSDSNDSSDDNDSSGSSSSGSDSDESGSADGESSEGESSEGGDDADTEGDGTEYYSESGSGRQTGPSGVVQGIVDRATGQTRDPDSAVPQPCGQSGGFGVTQPGVGGSGNCVPGHLPTITTENDEQPETPDAGASADAEDARRAGTNDIAGNITQPGLGADGIPVEDLPSGSPLDRAPVVNPVPD